MILNQLLIGALVSLANFGIHALMTGYGYDPIEVAGSDPDQMHQAMAAAMDRAFDAIRFNNIDALPSHASVVYRLAANEYNGVTRVQFIVEHAK